MNPVADPGAIPVIMMGPGSQPLAEEEMAPLAMPSGMQIYAMPQLPEPEAVADRVAARAALTEVLALLGDYRMGDASRVVDISHFDDADRDLMDQVLAVGEVRVLCDGSPACGPRNRCWRGCGGWNTSTPGTP